ncbi:MAG: NAD(P)/FAD-dependent oxidoreductase [Beijerinckiaceae bacterium]|nr:NAD(P)/FAD-dependent oxidoreductase [Beijerinckiaceae bacterium]
MPGSPDIDVLVIGAGVIGLAVARALAQAGRQVMVVEAGRAIGTGVSSRSSEVIHAGIYYPPGSLKTRLCVEGRAALYDYCASRGVAHARCGKLIVAGKGQGAQLLAIAERARANGVELALIEGAQARAMEPELECEQALHSPHTGIVDSHGLMLALEGDAQSAGASFAFGSTITGGRAKAAGVEIDCEGPERFTVLARTVVLCASLASPRIARSIEGIADESVPCARFAKGSYFSLARRAPFSRLIYPVPEPGGLGVHLTLDLAGRARFGPDVEWLDASDDRDIDYSVDPARAERFYEAIRRYWPGLRAGELVADYSGVRPKIAGPGEPDADFAIHDESRHGVRGLVALYGIESPGLTSALAIARHVIHLVNTGGERSNG